jgi:purine-binding chemotaxis protein CheW
MDKDLQIVGFQIGKETFGLPIAAVREVIRLPEITVVPNVPDHIQGVMNLRGKIIPVIDLPKKFGAHSSERSVKNRIVVVELDGRSVGLIVHSASEVLRLPQSKIEHPQDVFPDSQLDYVSGVGKLNGRLVILLDLQKIMRRTDLPNLDAHGRFDAVGAVTVI